MHHNYIIVGFRSDTRYPYTSNSSSQRRWCPRYIWFWSCTRHCILWRWGFKHNTIVCTKTVFQSVNLNTSNRQKAYGHCSKRAVSSALKRGRDINTARLLQCLYVCYSALLPLETVICNVTTSSRSRRGYVTLVVMWYRSLIYRTHHITT